MSPNAITALRTYATQWVGGAILLTWLVYLLITPTIGIAWIESWHNEQRAVQVILLACTAVAYCPTGVWTRLEVRLGAGPSAPYFLRFWGWECSLRCVPSSYWQHCPR